ncbi:MAG: hypothetical protein A4E19_03945 [Nitrospira sp. SG-bin1]|nr:MAG: hypothetical protein A4E19_03945 [Nitrospira sp. SG-bin1]
MPDLVSISDPQDVESPVDCESDSEVMFGGGMLRTAFSGGNWAKRCIRSSFIALAFSSVKPGLRSPTTLEENEDMSRMAWRA